MLNAQRVRRDFVVIGASAGGVQALHSLFCAVPAHPPFTLIAVLHRSPYFVTGLPGVLGLHAPQRVSEPVHGQLIERGHIYLAPRDHHLRVRTSMFLLDRGPKEHHTRPAIDPLFFSAAREYGSRVIGVLLTGGGEDGTAGLTAIRHAGGIGMIQDPEEATHPWMPLSALRNDHVDLVLPLVEIAPALLALAAGEVLTEPATL
jgi:two-component system chemotaxis response regulator CheB